MLITSPAAGDGKSTLVSNLAIAIARAGQKTLIPTPISASRPSTSFSS